MKHWTDHLPEGKRIFQDEVRKIGYAKGRIKGYKRLISVENEEINELNKRITALAHKQYTNREIQQAKREFRIEL